jgi:putative colanic acid biosynthesis glycosyltransferase
MLLSVITVAFRNYEGVMKTWESLAHLAQAQDIAFEWIVVDGGSADGTAEFLKISTASTTYVTSARKIMASMMR